ncbi:unnamed protein product [Urochloa humidicola]
MRELALGLELSGQRFLWVVRSASDKGLVRDNYYDAESKEDPFVFLPEGFVGGLEMQAYWCPHGRRRQRSSPTRPLEAS